MCINMAMSEQIESAESLRPHDEIEKLVNQSIDLRKENPADYTKGSVRSDKAT